MKRTAVFFFAIVLGVAIFASSSVWAQPVKWGVVIPLSGEAAYYGLQEQLGITMSLEEINGAGGIKGVGPLEVIYLDHEANRTKGVIHALRMIRSVRVHVLSADINSSVSLAVLPVAEKEKIPMLNVLSSTPHLNDQGAKWIIDSALTDAHQVPALVDMAINKYGMKEKTDIALLHDADDYGRIAADIAEKILNGKGYMPLKRTFNRKDRDFSGQLLAFKNGGAKTILIWGILDDTAAILKQIESLGLKFKCMGGSATGTQRLPDLAKSAAEGYVATLMFSADEPVPRVQEFVKKFTKRYPDKQIDWCVSQGYDGAYLIKAAVEKIGKKNFTKEELRDTLLNIKFSGVGGDITFDKTGSVNVPVLKVIVKNGKYTFYSR
jgi:branched-chain amino acid transport system substrate-binding protein